CLPKDFASCASKATGQRARYRGKPSTSVRIFWRRLKKPRKTVIGTDRPFVAAAVIASGIWGSPDVPRRGSGHVCGGRPIFAVGTARQLQRRLGLGITCDENWELVA